ncbi:uncharacterized protein TRIVIDRAFT_195990 [Trichoderma virens Gv29-8]|uniref:Uncharacterized protein n=1 Tax=Hypocrea virens (strain Gv29-8 / FGSC 10586) TaxID=413071 RepID=G9NBC7_HYPVG|nr:uncharacterized protein TRIVIDRAFT_195990 [Trichoderma virens Gv29-8]EHK16133.1 hypothetical protein TRIVIDRAFT_195990 [Trichoderma virens Gv29-8]UKZ56088.1 hypothetical protein TrVGV298_009916 [Trichoderma virens]
MIGPPDCSLSAFKTSLLHQCQFDLTTISLEACLGGSIDGYVWKSIHPESPILVNAAPTTRKDALNNHYAFSIEGHIRLQDKLKETPMTNTKIISEAPRLRKCYGWPNFKGRIIRNAHPSLWPPPLHIDKVDREMPLNRDYIAIVYEYIKDGENGPAIVKQMLEFLWFTGFSLVDSPHARNWTSGVLLDLCDVVPPRRSSWKSSNYGIRDVEMVLRS